MEADNQFSSKLAQLKHFWKRISYFWIPAIMGQSKFLFLKSANGSIAVGSLLSFIVALSCGYFLVLPKFQPPIQIGYTSVGSDNKCNVFQGNWVREENYPLYNASDCPFAERGFDCFSNGRKDTDFTKWRWKPKLCDIPRFDSRNVLEHLRGKRVVFVGDSLSRTQWESFICLLMSGVKDKKSVYELNGNEITKQIRFLGVRFESYNLRVDFYRSVFLVQPGPVPKRAPRRVKTTLRIDKMDDINKEWVDSDVLIFNSGHWWNPTKLFELGWYFQQGGSVKLGMSIPSAFKLALKTWASWVENNIDTNRTSVFFRTFESAHWSGKNRDSCKVTDRPSLKTNRKDKSPVSDTIIKVVNKMTTHVTVLHVTPMGAYRGDAHVGSWGDNPLVPDCSHWCLPGVPDAWNEILVSYLLPRNRIELGDR